MQLTGGGGGEGGGVSPKELLALQEKLQLSENLISDLSKTWEQKLAEATRAHLVGVVRVWPEGSVCISVNPIHFRNANKLWRTWEFQFRPPGLGCRLTNSIWSISTPTLH